MAKHACALIELLFTSHDGITLGHYEKGTFHSIGVVVAGLGPSQGADSVGVGFGGFSEWQTDRIFLERRCVVRIDQGRCGTTIDAASSSGSAAVLVAGWQTDCLC
jgi:hypothetical protein